MYIEKYGDKKKFSQCSVETRPMCFLVVLRGDHPFRDSLTLSFAPLGILALLMDLRAHLVLPLAHVPRRDDVLKHDLVPRNRALLR